MQFLSNFSQFSLNENFSLIFLFLLFNPQCRSLLSACVWCTAVRASVIVISFLFITFLVVLELRCQLQLSPSSLGSAACRRLALWVGGSCMRGTLWAACCGLYSPLNLCSVCPRSLHFSFFLPFSLSSCGGGKSYGAVYLFWFGVGSHMSLAEFHTSMTVTGLWRIILISCTHVCCPHWCHYSLLVRGQKTYAHKLALLRLKQPSVWLPAHFLTTLLRLLTSRDSSFLLPFPSFVCLSCLCSSSQEKNMSTLYERAQGLQLSLWFERGGFKVKGGLWRRRRWFSERQTGSWALSIRLFPLILNCSHWKTLTSWHVFTINATIVRCLFSPGEKDETGEE